MSVQEFTSEDRSEFNLTTASTLHHLIAVGVACVGLWAIIAANLGV